MVDEDEFVKRRILQSPNLAPNPDEIEQDRRVPSPPLPDEVRDAATFLDSEETAANALARIMSLRELEQRDSRLLSVPELEERYPNVEFTEPTEAFVAEEIARRQRKRMEKQNILARGDTGGMFMGMRFLRSLGMHAIDPIEFGVGTALSGALAAGRALKHLGGQALRFGKPAAQLATRSELAAQGVFTNSLASSFAFDVAGNLAVEPAIVIASEQDGKDYTTLDALVSVLAMPAALGGIRFAASRFFPLRQNDNVHNAAMTVANEQVIGNDQRLNLDFILRQSELELSGQTRINLDDARANTPQLSSSIRGTGESIPGQSPATRILSNNAEALNPNVRGQVFFGSSNGPSSRFNSDLANQFGIAFGRNTLDGSSNGFTANNIAASAFAERAGTVFRFRVKDNANVLDADAPIKGNKSLEGAIAKTSEDTGVKLNSEGSFRRFVDSLNERIQRGEIDDPESVYNILRGNMRDAGFDGFSYRQDGFGNTKGPAQRFLKMFNEDVIEVIDGASSDATIVPRIEEVEGLTAKQLMEDINSRQNQLHHNEDVYQQLKALERNPGESRASVDDVKEAINNELATLEEYSKLNPDDARTKELLDKYKARLSQAEEIEGVYSTIETCMRP